MKTQITTLTATQIQSLYSTSVQLALNPSEVVPPNGFLVFHGAFLTYNPGSTPFGIVGSPSLAVQYSSGVGYSKQCSDYCMAAGLIDQTVPSRAILHPMGCNLPLGVATLYLASNASSAFTSGNGTLSVALQYSVHP